MALRDELIKEQCFNIEQSTVTLTIETETERTMLSWLSFRYARWKEEAIELHFVGWRIDILGKGLEELWLAIQQQTVQVLRESRNPNADGCQVHFLKISAVEETDAE